MRFLTTAHVMENFPPNQALAAQQEIGAQLQRIMQSGKTEGMGVFAECRTNS